MRQMQEYFTEIKDPRHQSYVKHKLADVLIIVMSAVLCGLDELSKIEVFAKTKAEFFKKYFAIDKVPSKPTLSRILSIIDGKEVAEAILNLMKDKITGTEEVIAIDGKAIRSTASKDKPHSSLQILTAYLTENGIILGQEKIDEKSNEIPALQQMLKYLNIKGKILTADALHCQKETCAAIVKRKGNYVLGLKANQKSLYEDVKLYFEQPPEGIEFEVARTSEKNKGRVEKRTCRKASDIGWLQREHKFPGLKAVISVEREIGRSRQTSYYISSAEVTSEKFLQIVREHWKIESLHWQLDVVFNEDESEYGSENAHLTLNILRKFALMKHKIYLSDKPRKSSFRGNMLKALLDEDLLLDIITV